MGEGNNGKASKYANGQGRNMPGLIRPLPVFCMGLLLVLISLPLMWNGAILLSLGGSAYYAAAGLALAGSGLLLLAKRASGIWLFGATYLATLLWSLAEVGPHFWPLWPRLMGPTLVAILVALTAGHLLPQTPRILRMTRVIAGINGLLVISFLIGAFFPHDTIGKTMTDALRAVPADGKDWSSYGRTVAGTRFAPIDQITPANVKNLQPAWTFRTGDTGAGEIISEDQNTPLQIGDTLYACTRNNVVFALDADTGKARWTFDPQIKRPPLWHRCRGLAYHETAAANLAQAPICAHRLLLTTMDSRLIAIDAATGRRCPGFGQDGIVSLSTAMGEIKPGYYMPTSAPLVAGDRIIIGGWVFDNQDVGEPSGVIRAFNVETGALVWAWDMGAPNRIGAPGRGETYTKATPNMWSTPSYDPALGLVYVPMGNQTPDFWGAHRKAEFEHYAAAAVALNVTDGRPRWSFQTTLHDLWDYDVPSQPALYDVPDGKGGHTPALLQTTKRGDIFMLDRRTGKPLAPVAYAPAPRDGQAGERVSPVQPRSIGMPMIGNATLRESDMWGASIYDQLLCRIAFKRLHYNGMFTPPTVKPTLAYPGYYGGMNWGSAAINATNDYLIVNDLRVGIVLQLIPQAMVASVHIPAGDHDGIALQTGTPYAVNRDAFMSPLGAPCQAPPYGTLTAIDLKTRKIAWQVPMGTLMDGGLMGIKFHLPIPIGMPTLGGPITTSSGLIFFAGSQDYFLRALDVKNGQELWRGRLPVGAQATPLTYVSPKSHRQYVVISAGGARKSADKGDYIIAYALPKK